MREKLNALPLNQLREIAKSAGLKGISTLKKADLIERLMVLAEERERTETQKHMEQPAEEKAFVQSKAAEEQKTEAAEEQKTEAVDEAKAKEETAGIKAASEAETAESAESTVEAKRIEAKKKKTERPARQSAKSGKRPGKSAKKTADAADTEKNAAVAGKINPAAEAALPGASENETDKEQQEAEKESTAKGSATKETVPEDAAEKDPAAKETVEKDPEKEETKLDSGIVADGILEVMADGYGFIRSANYLPGENDVYVSPSQIKKFGLKTGDMLVGKVRVRTQNEKFGALLRLDRVNGLLLGEVQKRRNFEDLTPIFPNERLKLEQLGTRNLAMRVCDLVSPIGKGQRGMIVSPPKAGKTTLLKSVAHSIQRNNPEVHILILLIDERPEEVTDIREDIVGRNVEVIYSTFDELPEHHKRVSEMVIERAKRLVELGRDVVILLDSITRLARAYNLLVPPSGRTLSGGLDPAALYMPKRFFGAARNIREGGSLTILATALVDTGSKMDDVVYEEFKGTGNMELLLDRKLQEKRIFPAIDIAKSGTRRDDLLLSPAEQEAVYVIHKATGGQKAEESTERILDLFARTRNNAEFVEKIKLMKYL